MKLLLLLILFMSATCWSKTEALCDLTEGIYKNSTTPLREFKFETFADLFTLNNAKTLSMNLNGETLSFSRTDIKISQTTEMIFVIYQKNKIVKAAKVVIDRKPKDAMKSQDFYGNVVISQNIEEGESLDAGLERKGNLTYNYFCRF